MTRVADVMTRGVRALPPHESVLKAAQAMDELDVGAIPVCEGSALVGIVTDRDIVRRGVAQGCAASDTALAAVMTRDAQWCFEDQPIDEVVHRMKTAQLRRMPVLDREQQLVGMLALGDIATKVNDAIAGDALERISEPSVPDRSSQSAAAGPAGGGTGANTPPRRR